MIFEIGPVFLKVKISLMIDSEKAKAPACRQAGRK
jgi:hypothetical protein